VVDVGGGDVVGGIDDDGTTVGDVDGVTEGVTDAVGDGMTGETAEVDGITGATTGGTLEVAPVACRMSKGFVAFGPGWLPP
jgi:hypothetical protein